MFAKTLKKTTFALVLGAAALIPSTTFAGDVRGPGCHDDSVLARRTDVYRMTFEGGRQAYVGIQGDRDTDLDLEVRDENGIHICTSNGENDLEACTWTPLRTGQFQIHVKNLGGVYNDYRLCTN